MDEKTGQLKIKIILNKLKSYPTVRFFCYLCYMKDKLKTHKLVGLKNTEQNRLNEMGKLIQKGLSHVAYYANDKHYYWVKRGNKI